MLGWQKTEDVNSTGKAMLWLALGQGAMCYPWSILSTQPLSHHLYLTFLKSQFSFCVLMNWFLSIMQIVTNMAKSLKCYGSIIVLQMGYSAYEHACPVRHHTSLFVIMFSWHQGAQVMFPWLISALFSMCFLWKVSSSSMAISLACIADSQISTFIWTSFQSSWHIFQMLTE